MAKMFYTLEETAQKLGKSVDDVKQMATEGRLQQFRDRDKVMFKVDQVDNIASSAETGDLDSSTIPLSETGDETDALNLSDAPSDSGPKPSATGTGTSMGGTGVGGSGAGRTGISVFDADEIEAADPGAQTVISAGMGGDEDMPLEQVGSGSGLLDLTRESDDTSLGAELLEEIYPGGATGESRQGTGVEGMFETGGGMEGATGGLGDVEGVTVTAEAGVAPTLATYEPQDPVASGWAGGLLIGAMIALVIGLIVVVNSMSGVMSDLAGMMGDNLMIYLGALVGVTAVFAVIGLLVGKASR